MKNTFTMRWIFIYLFVLSVVTAKAQSTDAVSNRINEERFIHINGINQWVTIKGDSTMPVILFLHGGPGSPLSPYADAVYGDWEKDFTLVQWDQRGTGKTFGAYAPEELTPAYLQSNPLTLEKMTADGITLTQYLLHYLKKDKLILFGSSWGSVLGVKLVQKHPELFYAYIGHSQVVNPKVTDLSAYQEVFRRAQKSKDDISFNVLRQIGKPPYDTARNAGRFMRIVKKYQQRNTFPPPASWFVLSAAYNNKKDSLHRSDGDDYSFVNYVGDKRLGVTSISSTINFFNDAVAFEVPVYFIQGEEDIQTPPTIIKDYFKRINAPAKKLILLPKTEHGFNQAVVDAHLNIMKTFIIPAINHKRNLQP
jgi:pimeloyl-ACP methyl ester carboxylesterase